MYLSPAAAGPAGLPTWSVQDNIPVSPSLDLDDDQFISQFFDLEGYYRPSRATSLDPFSYPSPPRSPPRSSPGSSPRPLTTDFINGLPAVTHRFGNLNPYGMGSSYGSDGLSSGYEYAAVTPDLVNGGSSPSDHNSPASLDQFEEYGQYPAGVNVRNFKTVNESKWSYPPAEPRILPRGYSSSGDDDYHYRVSESSGAVKRRRSDDKDKKTRQLHDRGQTADVRKSGACLPCRVSKTRVRHVVPPSVNRPIDQSASSARKVVSVPRA
jgi:hypothetical protein